MTDLTTDSKRTLREYRQALDAAGVDYEVHTLHKVKIGETPAEDVIEDAGDDEKRSALPAEGTNYRAIIEAVAEHPKEWVTSKDLSDELMDDGKTLLAALHRDYDVFQRKRIPQAGRGQNPHGYKLKEPYRRELTGQSIDVDALTEARNA